jgi:peptidoglycan/LPS O-acetylase OafA/YrhL
VPEPRVPIDPGGASKLVCLEALRGMAALAVVVGHLILAFWPGFYFRTGLGWGEFPLWLQTLARFPGKFLWDGHTAVSIFFVLSGFVLSLSYFQGGAAPALGSAALRRYPRLMLPAAASILLALTLLQAGAICNQDAVQFMNQAQGLPPLPDHPDPAKTHSWLAGFYNMAPSLAVAGREAVWSAFSGSVATYNLVLWTMAVELNGSFLVFGFLALFGSLRNRWLVYGIAGGLFLLNGSYDSFFYLDFLLGMALCDLWVRNQRSWRWSLSLGPALGLIAAALFLVPWKPLAALLLVGAAATAPRLQQLLAAGWLAFLGRVSFGLYLVHMPIFCSVGCGIYLVLCRNLGWTHTAGGLSAALASLAASVLTAWLFYRAVDRPTIALTRRLDCWLFRPRANATPTQPAVSVARAA